MAPNQSGIAASAISYYNDRGDRERWPVLVYRLKSKGWEVYCDPDMEAASASATNHNASKKNGANQAGKSANANDASSKRPAVIEELTAAPRSGCIEVRKMRLRIRLFEQHSPWNNPSQRRRQGGADGKERQSNNDGDGAEVKNTENTIAVVPAENSDNEECESDGWNNNALVVRRQNTLLISTRRGMGAIVFQFKSNQECLEFCDRLVYLNRDYFNRSISDSAIAVEENGHVNGLSQSELYCNELREYKRRRYNMLGDQETLSSHGSLSCNQESLCGLRGNESDNVECDCDVSSSIDVTRQYQRKEELMSYIVRLAHDDSFRGFVDELERGLEMAPDCSGVHTALH